MRLKNRYKAILLLLLFFTGCIQDPEVSPDVVTNASKPSLGKVVEKETTTTTIELESEVLSANGYPILERGFCIGAIDSSPVEGRDSLVKVDVGEGKGTINHVITGLNLNTMYYFRSYAKNRAGISYGASDSTQTYDGKGRVRTFIVEQGHATTAKIAGKIEQHGEGKIVRKGVYYSESEDMANKDSVINLIETDSFVCNFIGLEPSTKYYVQAFVTTNLLTFSDPTCLLLETGSGLAKVDTVYTSNTMSNAVDLLSRITDVGDAPVETYGFCWSENADPTIDNFKTVLKNGKVGPFVGVMSNLSPLTTYYIRAYATNTYGTAYGVQVEISTLSELPTLKTLEATIKAKDGTVELKALLEDMGHSNVISSGFCYSFSNSIPTKDNSESVVVALNKNDLYKEIPNLKGGKKYYVRAFAENSEGINYSYNVVTFETPTVFSGDLAVFGGKTPTKGSSAYFMIENKAYLLGGDIGPNFTNEMWSYDPVNKSWDQWRSFPAGQFKWQSAVAQQPYAYVLGGVDNNYEATEDFYRYDSNSSVNKWEVMAKGPSAAYSRVGVATNGEVNYLGGKKDTVKNEVWSYSVSQNKWIEKAAFPAKQYGGVALNVGGIVYAGLGKDPFDQCNSTLWKSSDNLNTWKVEVVCTGISGGILAGVVFKGKIYVVDEDANIFEYEPVAKKWTAKSRLSSQYRDPIQCMYAINDQIYIGMGNKTLIAYSPLWDN